MNPEAMTPEPQPLRVSVHAEQRFVERHHDPALSLRPRASVMKTIRKHLARSKPIELPPGQQVSRLMKWGEGATYLEAEGWVFVVKGRTVVTIENRRMWRSQRGMKR